MKISLIVAMAENGVIGRRGDVLPWRLPADLAHFRQITTGHPIIMGRKTYETIGKPLPGRQNIIITRNPEFVAEGCDIVNSLDEALRKAEDSKAVEAFIIGGGEIFKMAQPRATKLYLTLVHASIAGDTYFKYDKAIWQEIAREDHEADEKNEYNYSFLEFKREPVAGEIPQ